MGILTITAVSIQILAERPIEEKDGGFSTLILKPFIEYTVAATTIFSNMGGSAVATLLP